MQCPYPISIRNPNVDSTWVYASDGINFVSPSGELQPPRIEVPCGRCIICQENRRNDWAARMELESRTASVTYFITLTYSPEFVPPELSLKDLQKFIKRFRHRVSFRYFACGEYGDRFQRPHYHMICWLSEFVPLDVFSVKLNESWKFGFTDVREADRNAFRYCAKYTLKSLNIPPSPYLQPPFAVMSRNPGISFSWFKDASVKFNVDFLFLEGGIRQALPRYNLGKLDPVHQLRIKEDRRDRVKPSEYDQIRSILRERSIIRKYHSNGKTT